jgi:hypothetical protein
MLSVAFYWYTKYRYAECHNAQCRYAELHYGLSASYFGTMFLLVYSDMLQYGIKYCLYCNNILKLVIGMRLTKPCNYDQKSKT